MPPVKYMIVFFFFVTIKHLEKSNFIQSFFVFVFENQTCTKLQACKQYTSTIHA